MIRSAPMLPTHPGRAPVRGPRRVERSRSTPAYERPRPTYERGHRQHDIRCREADEEIRDAFGAWRS
ncbi:hypothetical protein ABXN37_15850 [Piscinibacter sakaiensis]|uniref:Uncharacterized protein n=1 Tax=Piscinibacter sakaiensis TaxID=1547922 RepID=A0A0K8P1W7_PISS1|nr:hypothetical protein [Piscinibacter sakaiensis]GAP36618.1 hypothetical protein ISF6_2458 [Piscinibacter sakaiensis]